jgi:hypothetical protein
MERASGWWTRITSTSVLTSGKSSRSNTNSGSTPLVTTASVHTFHSTRPELGFTAMTATASWTRVEDKIAAVMRRDIAESAREGSLRERCFEKWHTHTRMSRSYN